MMANRYLKRFLMSAIGGVGMMLSVLALVALTLLPSAALAQGVVGAYGPTGSAIIPQYAGLLGAYSKSMSSGTIGAGASANSPVFSFRYGGSGGNVAVVRRVNITVAGTATAFAAGTGIFEMYAARSFTASDTGGTAGTLTGNNSKLRTSFPTTQLADFRISSTAALSAGTRTLDSNPLASVNVAVGTSTSAQLLGQTVFYEPGQAGDYPLILAANEGFVIQATVPATGTWSIQVRVDWEEYSAY